MSGRWAWVRTIPQRPGGGLFEACASTVAEPPPGDGWIEVPDDALVDLLSDMQSRMFAAESALARAKRSAHAACDAIELAQRKLRPQRSTGPEGEQ